MARNIPPLVSSTPPPLNAFDDEEEEEEDEFGLYNTAEEIDYSEFEEKDKEKQSKCGSKGEQDSTSQDSATDSGLCPDSEGMSPTLQSDDERTLKNNSCDELCHSSGEHSSCQGFSSVSVATDPSPHLINGHDEDNEEQESDDNFGNFKFALTSKVDLHIELDDIDGEDIKGSPPSSDINKCAEKEHQDEVSSIHFHNKQSIEVERSKQILPELSQLNSSINGPVYADGNGAPTLVDSILENSNSSPQSKTSLEELDDISSNDTLCFESLDSRLIITNSCQEVEKNENENCLINPSIEDNLTTMTPIEESKETINENSIKIVDEDDFDDFTDFKAGVIHSNMLSQSEQSEQFGEKSNSFKDQPTLDESALPLTFTNQEVKDDEFSEFADFSSPDCVFNGVQSSDSLNNIPQFPTKMNSGGSRTESEFQDWASVFPCEDDASLFVEGLLRQDDVVWSRLFPLESSPAISYQWSESLSNRRLLTALNIDSRNILLTPWSLTAVPRFAANLSCGPLEPVKASEPQTVPPTTISTSLTGATAALPATTSVTMQELVPDAHFDWVGSGLTNPLDSSHNSLLDLNFIISIESQLATSLKTVTSLQKTPSAEAENLLASLPDISFMRKTYIDFPITSNI